MRCVLMLVVGAALVAAPVEARAQTTTVFLTDEATTGLTKQCFYRGLSVYTRTVSSTTLCPLSIEVSLSPVARGQTEPSTAGTGPANAWTALGNGLQELGATLQAERDARARRTADSLQAAALAHARADWPPATPGVSAPTTWDAAYKIVVQSLVEEYRTTEAYARAAAEYQRVYTHDGADAANRYWATTQPSAVAYLRRRWAEISPWHE